MPRPKRDFNNPSLRSLTVVGNFKSYSTDLLFDFETMYKHQFDRFRHRMDDDFASEIENNISTFHKEKAGLKVSDCNRVYLLTSFHLVPLVMRDVEDCIVDHLDMASIADITSINNKQDEDPDHVITLFVFRGNALKFYYDVSFWTAAQMLIAFQSENLINAGSFRYTWYNGPRRKAREERRL